MTHALRLQDVHKRYGARDVLTGLSLDLARGGRLGVIGPAGSGKTVICKLACGLEAPDRGAIELLGEPLAGKREPELGAVWRRVGMLFQNHALFDFMSVGENVAFPLVRRGVAGREIDDRVRERLRAVGLAGNQDRMPFELSGGMRKRVGIARATVARPELVIYDEPTAGLDPVTTSKIYDLIRADQEETGGTVVLVSSDVDALIQFADTIAMLYQGTIHYQGPAAAARDADDPVVRQFVRGELEGPL